jgi:hypothetical protein
VVLVAMAANVAATGGHYVLTVQGNICACGDGVINAGEECDGAGLSATCNANCTLRRCGDHILDSAAGEACDTGGESATCNRDCTLARCGDGVANISSGEACDTAGPSATCNGNCTLSRCGDGNLNPAAGEVCDSPIPSPTCTATCTLPLLASSTTLVSSKNPAPVGETITLTATVTPADAMGSVTFRDGAVDLQTVALAGGVAHLQYAFPMVGSHSLTASYGGDARHDASVSAAVSETVGQAATAITLMSSLNPSMAGGAVTLTAVVSPAAATGTVTFKEGAVVLGTQAVAGGQAMFSIASLPLGTHTITATYGGDTNYLGSASPAVVQGVNPAPLPTTTTTLGGAPNPSTYGAIVALTASVSPSGATGTVTFMEAAAVLGTASLTGGSAVLMIGSLGGGPHAIVATYAGDSAFAASSSTGWQQTVARAGTTTVLATSANPATFGQSVTFTATVTSAATGIATGTVTASVDGTNLATAPLVGGMVAFTAGALVAGTHAVTVSYSGDANFAPSSAPPLGQVVSPAGTPDAGTAADAKPPVDAAAGADAAVADDAAADSGTPDDGASATIDGGSKSDTKFTPPTADGGCSCDINGTRSGNWMWLSLLALALVHRTRAARRRSAT